MSAHATAKFEGLMTEAILCAYCGYCRTVCPTYAAVGWESGSPRGRLQLTRLWQEGTTLTTEQMTRLYQCTLCGQCTQVCATHIDLREFWLAARTQAVERRLAPSGLDRVKDNIMRTGNIYAFPNDERADWIEMLDENPTDLRPRKRADIVYFVGCSSSFAPRVQHVAEAFVRVLRAAKANFTILGGGEVCCGFPLVAAGMKDAAQELIERNTEHVRAIGARTVVFNCPACRMMWRETYAPRLPGVELLHATELLAQIAASQQLPLKALSRRVTYHDPCDLGRNGGVYDAPRQVLAAIPRIKLVEAQAQREQGLCCGGGGDMEIVDPALTERVAAQTAAKLAATGAQVIATACPQCVRTLAQGARAGAPGVTVKDVIELLAEALDESDDEVAGRMSDAP